jgi:YVTN family beta-propeller protein
MRSFFVRAVCLAVAAVACRSPASAPSSRVFVTNEDSGDVSVLDPVTDAVIGRIDVGKRPRGIRVAPGGRILFVALSGSPKAPPGTDESALPPADRGADGIGVIDVASAKLVDLLPAGQDPESFDITPDGKRLYVANEETAEATVVDIPSRTVIARIPVGREPEGVAVEPSARFAYVTSEEDDDVRVVDTATQRTIATFKTAKRPRGVAFTPDGSRAFVTAELGGSIDIVDTRHHTLLTNVSLSTSGEAKGPRPMGVRVSPDGSWVYVTNGRAGTVSILDARQGRLVRTIENVGARPWGIDVTPDGKKLYVANGPSDDLSVIDTESGRVLKNVQVGRSPWGVAISK